MTEILVAAKAENKEALNIIIQNATLNDRTFPGIGKGSVADLKVSITLLGYNTDDGNQTSTIDSNLIWSSLGSGPTSKNTTGTSTMSESKGQSAVLFSTAGYAKNTLAFWNSVKSTMKIENFSNQLLKDLYSKTSSRLHRVFFVNDINDIEKYVDLFLPLFTTIN